jgi:DNA-binding CsgD family transcriptional regulator
MLPDKAELLEQINTAIKKKWSRNKPGDFDYATTPGSVFTGGLQDKSYIPFAKDNESIKKLEQRVESLEDLNDQLFYFVNFLVENLPDLVINIIRAEWETQHSITNNADEKETGGSAGGNDGPCPTRREKDILELLIKGFCAKEIAHRLFISETTVITHKKNLKEKFHAKNTVELISKAQSHCTKTRK